jgi:uncharacterized protein
MNDYNAPEQRTIDVDVEQLDTRGRTLHGYAAVYNVESGDLGGFREKIAPGAFAPVLADADVRALLNHDPNNVLGRSKSGTLRLFDEQRGLRFEVDLPNSPLGENVREAVARGDIDGASFRFVVDRESWDGDVRTVESVRDLKDVTVATFGAYPAASVELRTRDGATRQKEQGMDQPENTQEAPQDAAEERPQPAGSLQVEDRVTEPVKQGLAEEFRAAGFPGETATIDFDTFEQRAVTWTGLVDNINKVQATAGGLGYDQRYAWPAFQRVNVDAGATAVDVFTQTARTLASAANVVRAIDAVTTKPETASTLTIVTTALKQVASIYTNVPNIQLEQPAFNTVIENDLTLAINDGLDKLVLDFIATAGFQAPGTDPLLVSIRKAMTTIMNNGYNPDTLLLTTADAEALDVLVSGISGGVNDFVFPPATLAPANIFTLNRRISKTIPATAVVDSRALGKLYASPVTLARFEADSGTTNRGNVRMELNAVFGGERTGAAVRIAAA